MKNNSEDLFSDLSKELVDEYSPRLLGWAYNKLGDRRLAEELVQEVWLQVFTALHRTMNSGLSVQKEENFIWKIAHYVWCNHLRQNAKRRLCVSLDGMEDVADMAFTDGSDFVKELEDEAETRELISYMRQRIMNLNRLQREIMILYYIDNKPQKEIARMLGISLSAVKWHLFDTRKKLKEDLTSMKTTSAKNTDPNTKDFVYRPKHLGMGIHGQGFPPLDTQAIKDSLTRQNICIACRHTPQTLDMLTESLGIPKAYLEFDLEWLVKREFLSETAQGYRTEFLITSLKENLAKDAVWLAHKKTFADVILNGLTESEEKIRSIGFQGCDRPFDRLLWLLIYHYCIYQKYPFMLEYPVRPDGGRYFPLGFVQYDRQDEQTYREHTDPVLYNYNWGCNGSMCNDNFWWYGLYNFGTSEIKDMMDSRTPRWGQLHSVLCNLLHSDGDISHYKSGKNNGNINGSGDIDDNGSFDESNKANTGDEKYALTELAEKGFITISGTKARPNFCVFTQEQYDRLQREVFAPIKEKLEQEMTDLEKDFERLSRTLLPAQLQKYRGLFVHLALTDADYMTTVMAFNEGRLYVPKDRHDGEFLTLLYIIR